MAEKAQQALTQLDPLKSAFAAFQQTRDAGALFQSLKDFASSMGGPPSGLGKVLSGVSFLLGAAMVAEGLVTGNPDELLRGLVEAGKNAQSVAYGMEYASRVLPNLLATELSEVLLKKVGGVVTALAGGIQFHQMEGEELECDWLFCLAQARVNPWAAACARGTGAARAHRAPPGPRGRASTPPRCPER